MWRCVHVYKSTHQTVNNPWTFDLSSQYRNHNALFEFNLLFFFFVLYRGTDSIKDSNCFIVISNSKV